MQDDIKPPESNKPADQPSAPVNPPKTPPENQVAQALVQDSDSSPENPDLPAAAAKQSSPQVKAQIKHSNDHHIIPIILAIIILILLAGVAIMSEMQKT